MPSENAAASLIQPISSSSISAGSEISRWWVQRLGYGSVAASTRGESSLRRSPMVTVIQVSGRSLARRTGRIDISSVQRMCLIWVPAGPRAYSHWTKAVLSVQLYPARAYRSSVFCSFDPVKSIIL